MPSASHSPRCFAVNHGQSRCIDRANAQLNASLLIARLPEQIFHAGHAVSITVARSMFWTFRLSFDLSFVLLTPDAA
jgi:hypothetical protein